MLYLPESSDCVAAKDLQKASILANSDILVMSLEWSKCWYSLGDTRVEHTKTVNKKSFSMTTEASNFGGVRLPSLSV